MELVKRCGNHYCTVLLLCVRSDIAHRFMHEELADILSAYGASYGNALVTRKIYEE